MTDTELDTALRTHAHRWQDEFAAPPLAGMLEVAVASKRSALRWAGPLIAAVLLLAIPLITVVSLHHRDHTEMATASPEQIPATITVAGQTLPRLAVVDWTGPVIAANQRQVVVDANIDVAGLCIGIGPLPTVRAYPTSTSNGSVTITAVAFGSPSFAIGPDQTCTGVGHGPLPATVVLSAALGSRRLVDASTGKAHQPLAAASMPVPSYLPRGYPVSELTWDETEQRALRTYRTPDQSTLRFISVQRSPLPGAPYQPRLLLTGTVLGQPAKVTQDGSFTDVTCAGWTDSQYAWQVCSSGSPSAPISPTELLKIANSLR